MRTAIYAGVAVWFVGCLLPNAFFMYVPHLFPTDLILIVTATDLVEMIIGTIAGAALYKEAAASATVGTPPQTVRA